jgi:hypothetical protein
LPADHDSLGAYEPLSSPYQDERDAHRIAWLEARLNRAAYLVENLAGQVSEFTGVIGPGGEREDDYIRGQLYEEAQSWKT